MANFFDHFDTPPAASAPPPTGGNFFDQFDDDEPGTPTRSGGGVRAVDVLADSMGVQRPQREGDGVIMNTTAGLNEGIYNTLGAPVDLATGAINLGVRGLNAATGSEIPTIENPIGGSRSIARAFGAVGVPDPESVHADTNVEKFMRASGQGVGYALAPEMAVRGVAQATGRTLTPMLESLLAPSRSAGDAAANALVGGAAGGSAYAAGQAVPEAYRPTAEMAGGLAGGGLAALLTLVPNLAREGARAAGNYLAPLTEAGQERLAATTLRDAASEPRVLGEGVDPEMIGRVPGDPRPIEPLVPRSRPTTFQHTGDMGIGQLERRLETANPTPFIERRAEQNQARLDALESLQPTGSPEAVVNTLRQNLADIERMTGDELAGATSAARDRTAALGGAGTTEGYGAAIRQQLDAANNSAKARERELWSAVDPDGALAADAGGIRSAVMSVLRDLPKAAKPMSGEEKGIFTEAARFNGTMPFREIAALRTRLNDAMRDELSEHGSSQVYRRLTQLRGAVEDVLEGTVATRAAEDAQAVASGAMREEETMAARLLQSARNWYDRRAAEESVGQTAGAGGQGYARGGSSRISSASGEAGQGRAGFGSAAGDTGLPGEGALAANFDPEAYGRLREASAATKARAQTYDNGPVGDVLARSGSQGPFNAPAAVVPEKFFRRGSMGAEGMRALKEAAKTPETMATMRDYAVSNLRRFAEDADGTLNPNKVAVWRKAHADALRSLPEIDGMLRGPVEAAEAVARLSVERKRALDDYRAGAIGRLIDSSPEDVSRKLGAVFSTENPTRTMRLLERETANNPEARQGLRKGVADWITQRFVSNTEAGTSGQTLMRSDQFQTFMRQNEAALGVIFKPAELSMLKAIAADLQQANRSIASTKLPGRSNTAQDAVAQARAGGGVRSWIQHLAAPLGRVAAGTTAGGPAGGVVAFVAGEALDKLRRTGLERVDEILTDAILNPGRAAVLLQKAPPKPTQKDVASFASRYRKAAFSSVISAIDDGPGNGDEPLRVTVP